MTRPVRAGRLRHRVSIERRDVSLDSDGQQVEDWVPVVDRLVPAEIVALSGRELIAAAAVASKVSTRIKVRFLPGLDAPSMRVRHRGTVYDIEASVPDPDSTVRYLTLLCSSGVNEG